MRKFAIMLIAAVLILGCNKEDSNYHPEIKVQILEEYYPNLPKETITTRSGVELQVCDSVYILDGDILLSPEQVELLALESTKSAMINESKYAWPNGIVYFRFFQTRTTSFSQVQLVYDAMNYYHKLTGVEFRYVTYRNNTIGDDYVIEKDYIFFHDGTDEQGSYSYLGRKGGSQDLVLAKSWADFGTAVHEIGHAIGLLHEQSRADRDNYINVNYSNIQSNKKHNFDKSNSGHNTNAFDFNSIMIYSSYNSFAINTSVPTMTKKMVQHGMHKGSIYLSMILH